MSTFKVTIENRGHSSCPLSKQEEYTLSMDGREVFKSGWMPQSYWEDANQKAQTWADQKIAQLKMCL